MDTNTPRPEPNAKTDASAPDSNKARPIPPANTGSRTLNLISDTTFKLLQLERRFDRLLRPPFDALLRDPIARLTTAPRARPPRPRRCACRR